MEGQNPGVDILGAVASLNDDLWIVVDPARPERIGQKSGKTSPSAPEQGAPQGGPMAAEEIRDVGLRWI